MNEHLQQLTQWLQDQQLDVAYISNPTNISYFSGFFQDPEERVTALFAFPDRDPFLFTPALSIEEVKRSGWSYDVHGYLDHEDPFALIGDAIRAHAGEPAKWAIEKDDLPVYRYDAIRQQFPDATFPADASRFIEQKKLIKSDSEIALMDAAGREADAAFAAGFAALHSGVTEQAVVAEINYAMMKQGVMEMSFDTIVQAGANAANPHGGPELNQVRPGQMVLFDLGTVHQGYDSDATRTVAFGKVGDREREIHAVCLEANLAAMEAAKPGVTAASLDKIARDIITKAGYGEYFNHRLGHGIGTSTHEFPSIMEGNDMELQPGMCFSIEPGIYVPGFAGVRIEDCIHITADGNEPFTHTPKTLRVIEP
ncbi:Xaa-Pro peptidase family protein [uncultured Lacticaseibacillus sp.]|jgi:Xaa-Pro dipeptidase|uniref:M24 family metallopeptidase n=1 Tax=uncultured Lacticaseibacillus sp. TaxID=2775882 RepID=UPI002599B73A|nr:Xaa-Pro peptidase family protein [uncultured Lacticaseibacillus sp.]